MSISARLDAKLRANGRNLILPDISVGTYIKVHSFPRDTTRHGKNYQAFAYMRHVISDNGSFDFESYSTGVCLTILAFIKRFRASSRGAKRKRRTESEYSQSRRFTRTKFSIENVSFRFALSVNDSREWVHYGRTAQQYGSIWKRQSGVGTRSAVVSDKVGRVMCQRKQFLPTMGRTM